MAADAQARPHVALPSEEQDLVIVGGGLTGLWAAYYASRAAPRASITILEADVVGYGASGRNGGWLSPLIPGNRARYARAVDRRGGDGRSAVRAFQCEMDAAVDETLSVLELEGIDAGQHRGGHLTVATTTAALGRIKAAHTAHLAYGYEPSSLELLDEQAMRRRIDIASALGGLLYRSTARVDPAKLVHGLARVCAARGVRICEGTRAYRIAPGEVTTNRGRVRGRVILSCLEAYTGTVASDSPAAGPRQVIPVNSSMIVTEQLPAEAWERIGWTGRECLNDGAHTFVYAQRTDDDRIAIGGRGTPYAFGSGLPGPGRVDDRTIRTLRHRLRTFFPDLELPIEHAWRGSIGVTRDWCAGISYDPATGLGTARGFAGHGVTATNLAARTLLDRAAGHDSRLTRLPWNDHDSGRWEPEPIRWVGVHAMYRLFGVADAVEEATAARRTSIIARFGARLAGLHE